MVYEYKLPPGIRKLADVIAHLKVLRTRATWENWKTAPDERIMFFFSCRLFNVAVSIETL
jgi:hypothetical protein